MKSRERSRERESTVERAFTQRHQPPALTHDQLPTPQVNPACDEACYDTMCAKDANDFYAWAVSDELVAGFAPWHWHYDAGCKKFKDEIGTDVLPKTRAAWTAIGKKVIAGEAV